jgi:hypothetical protein
MPSKRNGKCSIIQMKSDPSSLRTLTNSNEAFTKHATYFSLLLATIILITQKATRNAGYLYNKMLKRICFQGYQQPCVNRFRIIWTSMKSLQARNYEQLVLICTYVKRNVFNVYISCFEQVNYRDH